MQIDPFCVFGLPRSRTSWLAQFLSYGGRECRHEGTATMGSFDEVVALLREGIGLSDTMLGLRAEDIATALPRTRMIIVRRDIDQVRASMAKIGFPMPGHFLDELRVALDIAASLPLAETVRFEDLDQPETCAFIFRHCLRREMPRGWYSLWRDVNVQTCPKSIMQAAEDNYTGVRSIYGAWL